ncbi:MAG: hypothetical protein ABS35_18275 [Kaistia sp. SCN 65-12]|nr:MAG: hypothetical protein ABS35_18275 [Kaistia sp. SCN 65-12]
MPKRSAPEPEQSRARTFERISLDGERYVPHSFRDGLYRVADPALGRVKHHAENQIAIRGDEIEDYLRRGFLLRMRGEISGQVNLIAASEITIGG